jgi:hypothetical protein
MDRFKLGGGSHLLGCSSSEFNYDYFTHNIENLNEIEIAQDLNVQVASQSGIRSKIPWEIFGSS